MSVPRPVLAMHQPNFLPWIGFFHKMVNADHFVLLNLAQVPQGRSYASRTKIKTPVGPQWLSLPISRDGKHSYQEQLVKSGEGWAEKLWKTLECNYASAPHWNYCSFNEWWEKASSWPLLVDVNTILITWAMHALRIRTTLHTQIIPQPKEDNPLFLCELYRCPTYLSGMGAAVYNDSEKFKEQGVKLVYDDFQCPEYPQLWDEFVPDLSIVDLIFNCGPEAREVLCS